MKKQKCSKCKKLKYLKEFSKYSNNKIGYRTICKKCINLYGLKYREKNKNKLNLKSKKYYRFAKEKIKKKRNIIHKLFPWKRILMSIKQRCNNSNHKYYQHYGGRGIKCFITEEEIKKLWFEYCAWRLKKPSIDRINNDGDYTYKNCRFIEYAENSIKNKRKFILQYDLQENFIRKWDGIKNAERFLNISKGSINHALKSNSHKSHGFIWRINCE